MHANPPAFLLGGVSPHLLGFVRSLGRRGIPVSALTLAPGRRLWSRYCETNRVFEDESALLRFLDRVRTRTPGKGVLIPTGDAEVLFLLRNRHELERHFSFSLPEATVLERLANKRCQYEDAARLGIPVPRTCWPAHGQDVRQIAQTLSYPCIVKPACSYLWRRHREQVSMRRWAKAAQAETPQELVACYEQMAASGVELLIQEIIEGDDDRLFSCYAYFDRSSEAAATFVVQKPRQWPTKYGDGTYSVSCREDGVAELTTKLLTGLGYRGLANVEFKRDGRDGQLKLIEVNCRSGNRVGLAVDSGVDLPYLAYRDLAGDPLPRIDAHETGASWIDLLPDLAALPHYRKTQGLTVWGWARSAWGARSHAYLAADDPGPFLAQVGRAIGGVLVSRKAGGRPGQGTRDEVRGTMPFEGDR